MHLAAASLCVVLVTSAVASAAAQRTTSATYSYLLEGQQCGGPSGSCPLPGACREGPWSFISCRPGTTCRRLGDSPYWRCLPTSESGTISTPGSNTTIATPTANIYTSIVSPTTTTPATRPTVITRDTPLYFAPNHPKTPDGKPNKNYIEQITIDPNAKVTVSPNRPNADQPAGAWIPGRATYYGVSKQYEAAVLSTGKGEPGMFGVIEDGSCGYTEVDAQGNKALPYPIDAYIAAADTNVDYPGSCGRCYQIRCRSGFPENDGRPLRIADLEYYEPVRSARDDQGRAWPGNPYENAGMFYSQCWDENRIITVKVGDSCPCIYKLNDGTVRRQWWCCGGNNHFDLSYWAFEKLVHPSYGVMKMEYRPVDCQAGTPLDPVPGVVDQTIYGDDVGAGWGWRTYRAKNTKLQARGEGLLGSNATCASLSKDGAIPFVCRECTRPGYQPFSKADILRFWIRSNSKSADPFESSTPLGRLPGLKVFLMNDEKNLHCGAEVVLGATHQTKGTLGSWYRFDIPLSAWACDKGSTGSLTNVNRVDFQNINIRDANICLDEISLI